MATAAWRPRCDLWQSKNGTEPVKMSTGGVKPAKDSQISSEISPRREKIHFFSLRGEVGEGRRANERRGRENIIISVLSLFFSSLA